MDRFATRGEADSRAARARLGQAGAPSAADAALGPVDAAGARRRPPAVQDAANLAPRQEGGSAAKVGAVSDVAARDQARAGGQAGPRGSRHAGRNVQSRGAAGSAPDTIPAAAAGEVSASRMSRRLAWAAPGIRLALQTMRRR